MRKPLFTLLPLLVVIFGGLLFQYHTQAATCPVPLRTPFKIRSSPTVYFMMDNCTKTTIKNPAYYFSYFDSWSQVQVVEDRLQRTVFDHAWGFLPWGPKRSVPNGSLIKTPGSPQIYLKVNSGIYPINNPNLYTSLGYEWTWVEDVDSQLLSKYNVGSEVSSPTTLPIGAVYKDPGNPDVFIVQSNSSRRITNVEELKSAYRTDRVIVRHPYNAPVVEAPPQEQNNQNQQESTDNDQDVDDVNNQNQQSLGVNNPTSAAVCGNGMVETGETCDGGSSSCTLNGYTGNRSCNNTCSGYNACQATQSCGDGVVNGNETCDDGNTVSGDGCSASCLAEVTAPPASGDGWTTFTASADTRRVYLSASGNDSNDCLTEQTACRTIDRGYSLLRHGYPDWLLLRRGDNFTGSFNWEKSGRSQSERMVLGTYGTATARPVVQSGTQSGFSAYWNNTVNPPPVSHLAIVGIFFHAHNNTAHSDSDSVIGMFFGGAEDILIEDVRVENYNSGMAFTGAHNVSTRNVTLRRNVVVSNWVHGGDSEGVYFGGTQGAQLIENVFDHNGWQEGLTPWSIFTLNVYSGYGSPGIVVRGNIFARADGIDVRSGGTVENNLFLRNAVALTVGLSHEGSEESNVEGTVFDNVFLEGMTLDPSNPRGFGLEINNVEEIDVYNNIFAHNLSDSAASIRFSPYNAIGVGVHNATIRNNIVYGGGSANFGRRDNDPRSNIAIRDNIFHHFSPVPEWGPFVNIRNNDSGDGTDDPVNLSAYSFSGNTYYSPNHTFGLNFTRPTLSQWVAVTGETGASQQQASFPNPSRSIAQYDSSIGGSGSFNSFITGARSLSKGSALNQPASSATWRTQYLADSVNDYIRAGFGR